MNPKKLEVGSKFAEYDLDQDGTVTDEEIARSKEMLELELREEKSEAQKAHGLVGHWQHDYFQCLSFYALRTRDPRYRFG